MSLDYPDLAALLRAHREIATPLGGNPCTTCGDCGDFHQHLADLIEQYIYERNLQS